MFFELRLPKIKILFRILCPSDSRFDAFVSCLQRGDARIFLP
jgi:hypothetical protein